LRKQSKFSEAVALYEQAIGNHAGLADLLTEAQKQRDLALQEQKDYEDKLAAAEREREAKVQQRGAPIKPLVLNLQFEKAQQETRRLIETSSEDLKPLVAALQA